VIFDDLKIGTVAVLPDDPDVARVERARNDECHRTPWYSHRGIAALIGPQFR
jgi:hypothetical protein